MGGTGIRIFKKCAYLLVYKIYIDKEAEWYKIKNSKKKNIFYMFYFSFKQTVCLIISVNGYLGFNL